MMKNDWRKEIKEARKEAIRESDKRLGDFISRNIGGFKSTPQRSARRQRILIGILALYMGLAIPLTGFIGYELGSRSETINTNYDISIKNYPTNITNITRNYTTIRELVPEKFADCTQIRIANRTGFQLSCEEVT